MTDTEAQLRKRIKFLLELYPRLGPSMLQTALGTSLPPGLWKPILEQMIQEGEVSRLQETHDTPAGRSQTYTILTLPEHKAAKAA